MVSIIFNYNLCLTSKHDVLDIDSLLFDGSLEGIDFRMGGVVVCSKTPHTAYSIAFMYGLEEGPEFH